MDIKKIIKEELDDFDWVRGITPIPQIDSLEKGVDYVIYLSDDPNLNKQQQSTILNKFDLTLDSNAIKYSKETELVNGKTVITKTTNGYNHVHALLLWETWNGVRTVGYFDVDENVNSYIDSYGGKIKVIR